MEDKDKEFIKTINDQLDLGNTYLLNGIFGKFPNLDNDKAIKKLVLTTDSKLLSKENSRYAISLPNYWLEIDKFYTEFTSGRQERIIEYIKSYIKGNNPLSIYMVNILIKYSSIMEDSEKILFYKEYFKQIYSSQFYNFRIESKVLKQLWFIDILKKGNEVYLPEVGKQEFEFDDLLFPELLEVLDNMDKHEMLYDYQYLLESTSVNLLEYVLKNDQIIMKEKQYKKLIKVRVIQRVYANLALIDKNIDRKIVMDVIHNVDEYKFYGVEMNMFFERFGGKQNNRSSNYYIDGIYSISDEQLDNEKSYIPINIMKNEESVDKIIKLLLKYSENPKSFNGEFIEYEQAIELSRYFKDYKSWGKYTRYFLEKLMDNEILRNIYEKSISDAICCGIKNGYLNVSIVDYYFRKSNHANQNLFSLFDEQILEVTMDLPSISVDELTVDCKFNPNFWTNLSA